MISADLISSSPLEQFVLAMHEEVGGLVSKVNTLQLKVDAQEQFLEAYR